MALAFPQKAGDRVKIYIRLYFFERIDPDDAVYYRAPLNAGYSDFMVDDANGFPRRPSTSEINAIFANDDVILCGNPSSVAVRRFARASQLDAAQCRAMDENADFRIKLAEYCRAHCHSLSAAKMNPVIARALKLPEFINLNPTNWIPDPSTVRLWIRERLSGSCGNIRDGVSNTGRHKRKLVCYHDVELLAYWLYQAVLANGHGQLAHFHDQYVADIYNINNGHPLNRHLMIENPEGIWELSDQAAGYAQPNMPYRALSYHSFWRKVIDLKTPYLFGLATSKDGEQNKFGGGGVGEKPSFGSLCEIDETPVPSIFLVDDDSGIPMGTATLTLMIECSTKALVGWDLCAEAASSTTLLRTVRHANSIKHVPADLLEKFPDLAYVRLRPDRIKCDNSSGAHSKHFEDACAEALIQVVFTGRRSPTHKALIERTIGTILSMLFKKLPSHNYDIALMRKFQFEPDTQVLCSLSKAKELLDRAVFTYNVSRHKGL